MKLYVAGPITGYPRGNKEAFDDAAWRLSEAGYDVVNPRDSGFAARPWKYYMRLGLKGMLECEGLALLDEWGKSRGACLEVYIAKELEMPIKIVDEWVKENT